MRLFNLILVALAILTVPATGFADNVVSTAHVCSNSASGLSKISTALLNMESPAEDMLDMISSKQVGKLKPLYKKLGLNMARLNQLNATCASSTQSKNIALQNSWFDLVSLEMKEMDDLPALAYAVNQFSGQLIMTTEFKHAYERNIAWMDYLGREIMWLSKRSGSAASLIRTRKTDLQKTWATIKPLLTKNKNGIAIIHQVDPVIHHLMIEKRPDRLIVLAQQEQELVDKIEVFFHLD